MSNAKIIAVAGKGGVGKTSISALTLKVLVEETTDKKVLAIDADPATGLSTALGIEVERTIDDIRREFIEDVEGGRKEEAIDILNNANYEIFNTLVEKDDFAFIAVGRPETSGCYCKVNNLLRDVISVLAKEFDYVIIDGEAGVEQVNRRVMEKVTHLLLVSDSSKKGTNVIQTVKEVADNLVMYDKAGAIINRVKDESVKSKVNTGDIEILNFIEEDNLLNDFDIEGKSIFDIPKDSIAYQGVKTALKNIGIL